MVIVPEDTLVNCVISGVTVLMELHAIKAVVFAAMDNARKGGLGLIANIVSNLWDNI